MTETRVYTCAVIKNSEDKYLLVKRSADAKFAAGEWEFVSGSLDVESETSEQCIAREVLEETGLGTNSVEKLEVFEIKDNDGFWVVVPFKVQVLEGEITISDEHSDFGWLTAEEVKNLPEMQDVSHLLV